MPTFDFQCQKCKTTFEFNRPFGSKVNPPCPGCASKKTEKLMSVPAIAFKGSGWYKTDSMSGGAKRVAKKEETKAVEGAGESKKTETPAPAKTTESKTAAPVKKTETK